jgi:hypothetical protein
MDFDSGLDALEIEQQVLLWLKNSKKLTAYLSKEQMPQGGHTETVDADSITLLELEKIIKKVIKGYKK